MNECSIVERHIEKDSRGLPFEVGSTSASKVANTNPILIIHSDFVTAIRSIITRCISGFNFGRRFRCGWELWRNSRDGSGTNIVHHVGPGGGNSVRW
jgi:hypothetical protein